MAAALHDIPSELSDQKVSRFSNVKTTCLQIRLLKTSRYQTRDTAFDSPEELRNLADSIRNVGLLEPPRVRKDPEDPGCFEIISGHRRISAVSKFLGWKEIECEIFENLDEFNVFKLNVTENLQRSNLSPYEEGVTFLLCEKLFGFSDEEIANRLHKSRSQIASRRELAVAANKYAKYADPPIVNAFLRHFSLGHREVLNRLTGDQTIKHAIIMIARGASVRHLQRFLNIFTEEKPDQSTKYISNKIHTHPEGNSEAALSFLEELKREMPQKFAVSIKRLEDRYARTDLGVYKSPRDSSEIRSFKCFSCQESYELSRKLISEQDKVLFTVQRKKGSDDDDKIATLFRSFTKMKKDHI